MDLNQTVAVVTGGSRGIGRQLAIDLASDGAHVVLAARDQKHLDATVDAIRNRGGAATALVCDVGDPAQVQAVIEATEAERKRIDLLVTCAAIAPPATVA
ncbi:MAG: SDR family NAD(P)-dependent oxidoreductase, partial [Acidimicrobiales bacterium]